MENPTDYEIYLVRDKGECLYCGADKRIGDVFCYKCYHSLIPSLQKELYGQTLSNLYDATREAILALHQKEMAGKKDKTTGN
jgi:5-methylcytosine-specific restriction endonuclease McrA